MNETLEYAEYVYQQWLLQEEIDEQVFQILTSNEEKEA
ncbi:hypothetical protein [Vibrio phage nt-1]|uniref:Uncharacterized protein n=1 Tax=Vibrio phage nt-1 TaxID=115992 RepID=A0A068J602_9CAUD|nr:hypothetical protein VPFG_p11 [Vibrio phage nt-1]AIE13783.1 hypothetical protein [Vibrio phage nt-1]